MFVVKSSLRALRTGTYSTRTTYVADHMRLSHSSVSRLITVAQLPSVIVGAFRTPDDIKEAWGVELQKIGPTLIVGRQPPKEPAGWLIGGSDCVLGTHSKPCAPL